VSRGGAPTAAVAATDRLEMRTYQQRTSQMNHLAHDIRKDVSHWLLLFQREKKNLLTLLLTIIVIIIIHEYHRDASLEQNFRAAMCHVLHYSCNV